MAVDLDETRFHVYEDGVEEEPGTLFVNVEPEEPSEEDFIDACTVARYYARNVEKVLAYIKRMNVEICEGRRARRLVGLTEDGGGYVVICEELNPYTYECKLVYYEASEL